MDEVRLPAAPKGLRPAGRRLWRHVVRAYRLSPTELALLEQAARVSDVIAQLEEVADVDVEPGAKAVVELRLQRVLLGRLLSGLRVEVADDDAVEDLVGRSHARKGA